MTLSKGECVVLAAAAAAAAGLAWMAVQANGGMPAPGLQPPAAEGRDDPEPDGHILAAGEHLYGVKFLPHRYPQRCGMQLTSVIHHGFSGIRVPEGPEARWITSPPSEQAW